MAMKKSYSLDYDIFLATDRNKAVAEILDNLETDPSPTDLEQMADYILFGKDEKFLSARDRKEILQPKRRYNSWSTKDEKNESLDALLEDPNTAPEIEMKTSSESDKGPRYKVIKPSIKRPTYDEEGNMIDPGDSDVPGMVELWERIDTLQERYDMYRGKIPPNDYVRNHPIGKYQLYKYGHMLIDIKRHQYYLKDSHRPTLKFFNAQHPGKQTYDFNTDTGLWLRPEEWCARKRNPKPSDLPQPSLEDTPEDENGNLFWKISENTLDYENPAHIIALLDNYVNLLKHSYASPGSSTRAICFDVERLVEESDLDDVEQFVLEQRVAHRNIFVIQNALAEEGLEFSELQIRTMMREKIPKKLAATATRLRLESDLASGRIEGLECSKCHKVLPKDAFYFARSRDKRTGFCSQCKVCQRESRDARLRAKGQKPHRKVSPF